MATGYDNREPGRASFAFQGPAPVQTRPVSSGAHRGAQVVGGRSEGGAVVTGPQTEAGPVAAGLGQFFEGLMQPYIERKQKEQFIKGLTTQMSRKAGEEVRTSNKGIANIFGPTSFEEGAIFYSTKKAVNEWGTKMLADMDNLKRLPPDELSKVIASSFDELTTGDPFTDQAIQVGLFEASGPLVETVSKKRFAWQQEEAVKAWSEAGSSGAALFQQLASNAASLADPSDGDTSAIVQAHRNFLSSMTKPEGMSDESYRSGLYNFMRNAMQDGNFYAVEAMRRAGIDRVFEEDDKVKLDDAYQRYGNKVLGRAALAVSDDLIKLDTRIKTEQISAMDAAKELARINGTLKQQTGADIDLFDYEDIRKTAGDVTDVLVASMRRIESRQWQLQDRAQDRAWKLEDEEREEAREAAQVSAVWGLGAVVTGLAAGLNSNDFDMHALNDYRAGNFKNIVNTFAREGWVSQKTAQVMQSAVTSAIGESYTEDFQRAYREWSALNAAKPGAASAYYGKWHDKMQRFDAMVRGKMQPNTAYVRVFSNEAQFSTASIAPQRRKEAKEAIVGALDKQSNWSMFGWQPFGRSNLNASSMEVVAGALANEVALAGNTDIPTDTLVQQGLDRMTANGALERYGSFAWRNAPGTKPLHQILRLQPNEMDEVFTAVLDTKLKAVGFSDGAGGDVYEIVRVTGPQGAPVLYVTAPKTDGGDATTIIGLPDLSAEAARRRGAEVRGNQPGRPFKPNRNLQRVIDQNRDGVRRWGQN